MTDKRVVEIGDVESSGVAVSDVLYFARDRIAIRLEGPEDAAVVALSRDAAEKLHRCLGGWVR